MHTMNILQCIATDPCSISLQIQIQAGNKLLIFDRKFNFFYLRNGESLLPCYGGGVDTPGYLSFLDLDLL